MTYSAIETYARTVLARIPSWHWAVMGVLVLALMVFLLRRKEFSVYGTIALGFAVFIGLFLLDLAVANRLGEVRVAHSGIDLDAEYRMLTQGGRKGRMLRYANLLGFIPLGFFLSEFVSTTKRLGIWRRIGYATLLVFGFSLFVEFQQWILRVGFFELTDLVLNTAGGLIGATVSSMGRAVLSWVGWVFGRRDSGSSPE
jgi:hypothetical protein